MNAGESDAKSRARTRMGGEQTALVGSTVSGEVRDRTGCRLFLAREHGGGDVMRVSRQLREAGS